MNETNEEEVVRNTSQIKDKKRRRILFALGLVFLISLVGGGSAALSSYFTLRGAAEDGTLLAQQINEECKNGTTSTDLNQFCPKADEVVQGAPSEVKSDPIPGPPGPTGPSGDPGIDGQAGPAPTPAQVLVAVRRFCAETEECLGKDGANATPSQVAIAVASYCNSRGECRGEAGVNGQDGADGQDGEDAPPVTQEQLVSAVKTFCTPIDVCRGEDGSDSQVPGPQGPAGPTGVMNVVDDCVPAPDGQVISDVIPTYDAASQTIILSCTYKDDIAALTEILP